MSPRHQQCLRDEVLAAGHWNPDIKDNISLNMPAADTMAVLGGFNTAQVYMVSGALLDPPEIPYFCPMLASIFPGVEAVHHLLCVSVCLPWRAHSEQGQTPGKCWPTWDECRGSRQGPAEL